VTDEDEALADDARDQVVEVGGVVEEVVVAAGPDPVGVAVTAQVRRDDVDSRGETLGDLVPAEREVEEAMDEDERRLGGRGALPFEDVVGESRREREPA